MTGIDDVCSTIQYIASEHMWSGVGRLGGERRRAILTSCRLLPVSVCASLYIGEQRKAGSRNEVERSGERLKILLDNMVDLYNILAFSTFITDVVDTPVLDIRVEARDSRTMWMPRDSVVCVMPRLEKPGILPWPTCNMVQNYVDLTECRMTRLGETIRLKECIVERRVNITVNLEVTLDNPEAAAYFPSELEKASVRIGVVPNRILAPLIGAKSTYGWVRSSPYISVRGEAGYPQAAIYANLAGVPSNTGEQEYRSRILAMFHGYSGSGEAYDQYIVFTRNDDPQGSLIGSVDKVKDDSIARGLLCSLRSYPHIAAVMLLVPVFRSDTSGFIESLSKILIYEHNGEVLFYIEEPEHFTWLWNVFVTEHEELREQLRAYWEALFHVKLDADPLAVAEDLRRGVLQAARSVANRFAEQVVKSYFNVDCR